MTPSWPIRISSSISVPSLGATAALGRAAPALDREVELGHQPVGERGRVQPGQPDRPIRAAYFDPGTRRQVDARVARRTTAPRRRRCGRYLDRQQRVGGHDQRPGEQGVRADRHDEQRLDSRPDDRAAGAEVVGRRACGRRQHHPVAAPPRQWTVVDLDDHLDHPLAGGLLDAGLVEREGVGHQLAVAECPHVQCQAVLRRPLALDDGVDDVLDVVDLGLGQEADVAQVDPEDRGPAPPRHLGGAQDRPVAAHDHRELAVDRQVGVAVDDLDRGVVRRRLDPEVGGLLGQQPDHDVVLGQRLAEAIRDVTCRVAPRVREQQDAPGRAAVVWWARVTGKPLRPHPRWRSAPHGIVDVVLGDLAGPRRSHRKNSTFPDGPGNGLVATARAPQPRAARSATAVTASARSAGSRTTPPLPTRSFRPRTAA